MQKRIKFLIDEISRHDFLYYIKAMPEISDSAYDQLFNELISLEKKYPELIMPESPTRRVGSDIDNDFPEITHNAPILSLDKSYTINELISWIKKNNDKAGKKLSYIVEEKIDGVSIILTYEQGILVKAATRGNGLIGNDITNNAKTIKTIPLKLKKPYNIEVRGEVFIKKKDFDYLCTKENISYDSPRNLAAGSLRRKNSYKTAKMPLDIFIYDFISGEVNNIGDHFDIFCELSELGFKTNDHTKLFHLKNDSDFNAFKDYITHLTDIRQSLEYEIDGLVIKVNENYARDIIGTTDRFPKWAIAFKFESKEANTIIESIDIQIGRLGRATPVARLKPVKISGALITNATLHNQDYIDSLEIAVNDVVSVARRGDVIPAVTKVIEKNLSYNKTWQIPEYCPYCSTLLAKDGAHHYCSNYSCPQRNFARLNHFAGKSGMDIENLGPKTIQVLIEKKIISKPEDIYTFNPESLKGLEGFQNKKISLIKKGILESKNRPFAKVLSAIGIKDLGYTTINNLIKSGINSIEKLLKIADENNVEALVQIDKIAETIAKHIIEGLSDPDTRETIKTLKEIGLIFFEKLPEQNSFKPFENQTWCVTGSFNNFKPRQKAVLEIEKRGGKIVSQVSSKTTHLLAGEKAGSKINKAKALNINIVNEDEFIKFLL